MRPKYLILGGLLLIAAALSLTAYNLWENQRATAAAQQALTAMKEQSEPKGTKSTEGLEAAIPEYVRNPNMEMPVVEIDGIEYIGTLEIPALELELPVISTWSDALLDCAPCRYVGSAYLDNLIIAGHNYRGHFGALHRLLAGEKIQFTDAAGNQLSYVAPRVEELPGSALEEMEAGDWDLTLFTCTLSRTSRITVRCDRLEE